MMIEQIWTGNDFRNFNYLIACRETGEALALDPFDHEKCLALAKDKGWEITKIVNTHEHRDHTGGNAAMIQATGAKLLAHHEAGARIECVDCGLAAGDLIRVGHTVELLVLDTPGHTMNHVCLLAAAGPTALFSGDALFNAGAGNCHGGGDPDTLYHTFATQFSGLSVDTLVYPGHDYLVHNLGFTLDREPNNQRARVLLQDLQDASHPKMPLVTTLKLEREINPFLRLTSKAVIDGLRETFPRMPEEPTPREVFLKLRELRNHW
jgi:hydroxyacylglutathione hydrolase